MTSIWKKEIGKNNVRKYAANIINLYLDAVGLIKKLWKLGPFRPNGALVL